MKNQIQKSIQSGLEFLATSQGDGGQFYGQAGIDLAINQSSTTDTIFFTALIADCLQTVAGSRAMQERAVKYLLKHKSVQWTWNYWERGSTSRSYPDDWDDTACALAAIIGYDSTLVDPAAQAHIARQLISTEVTTGGPYVTWLVPQGMEQWCDVDPAVNANVGHMLARLGVQSEQLEYYIADCIRNNKLQSPYYCGIVPTLYFIARWYRGVEQDKLGQLVVDQLKDMTLSSLERSMLIYAAVGLGHKELMIDGIKELLKGQQVDGSWPAHGLYYEPPQNGKRHYAGSAELTTAFSIQALEAWQQTPNPSVSRTRKDVTAVANVIARAGGWQVDPATLKLLNKASQQGWHTYTIYDDFLDGEGDVRLLGEANKSMRQSLQYFTKALPGNQTFTQFVSNTFDIVDNANTWEVVNAWDIHHLPNYGELQQLADRSWGHVIAPTGVLIAAGFALEGGEVQSLHEFFRHYIIARQLCDDAHDWQDDLARGHISFVITLLVAGYKGDDQQERRLYFWQHTVDQVNGRIRHHLRLAQEALHNCTFFSDTTELQGWLDKLEAVCAQAEKGKLQAQQFIEAFTEANLIN